MDRPIRDLESGIHTTKTTTRTVTAAFGIHSLPSGPPTRPRSHAAAPPPGADRTSRAQPAHTNDIARVTTMSGTRVRTTRAPFTAPTASPRMSTPTTTATLTPSVCL